MIYITKVHMEDGDGNEHIAEVAWRNPANAKTGQNSTASMVDWIDNKNGDARVEGKATDVQVGVVHADPPYLRTYADGKWSNNLLSLPRY